MNVNAAVNAAGNPAVKLNLLGLDADALARFFEAQGEKPFRARQVLRWIHHLGEADFAAMSEAQV